MCLSNLSSKKPLIAKEDIIVYKYLNLKKDKRYGFSPYKNYVYELVPGTKEKSKLVKQQINNDNYDIINIGLHSMKLKSSTPCGNSTRCNTIFKIPKGTKYYEGTFENSPSYASNTLEYVGKILRKRNKK